MVWERDWGAFAHVSVKACGVCTVWTAIMQLELLLFF
jgi:hypothetical protein